MFQEAIKLGTSWVGYGHPIYLIAELACAHEGDFYYACNMVDAAAKAKVSAVKLQVFTSDGLVVQNHKLYKTYKKFQFSLQQWLCLANIARQNGLDVLIDVFEPWSLEVANRINADGLKVHSTNVANPFFLETVAKIGLPVLLGIGGTFENEIKAAMEIMSSHDVPTALIHGFQAYPTSVKDTNLKRVQNLIQDFGVPVGFAGHADCQGYGLLYQNILALGMGCCLFENHIILDRSPSRTDYHSSLLPEELKQMVSVLRKIELALGPGGYELYGAEQKYRSTFKAFIVSNRQLDAGHILSTNDFACKRAEFGIVPAEAKRLIGKKLSRSVAKDEILVEDILEKEMKGTK